jgi:choline kinase
MNGISKIYIVTGFCQDLLTNYLINHFSDKAELFFINNPEYNSSNNIYSMKLFLENRLIEDDLILVESDLFYDPSLITKLVEHPESNVALVDKFKSGMDGTLVEIEEGFISKFIFSGFEKIDFYNKYKTVNIYKLSNKIINDFFKPLLDMHISLYGKNDFYEVILSQVVNKNPNAISALTVTTENWAELDNPLDYLYAKYIFEKNTRQENVNLVRKEYWDIELKEEDSLDI